jgi:hypothetical protein
MTDDKDTPEPLGAPEGPTPPSAPEAPDAPQQHGWEDTNGDGILRGEEIDMDNPFDAIDGVDAPTEGS